MIWNIIKYFTVAVLLYKVWVTNDVSLSVAADPMEIWIALGITALLMRPDPSVE